jgi:eukaryotic-like serine/threonine-protein kinase
MKRFSREAEVLASLNHPNIAAIYGLEDQALVLELVEGPTLADRIAQGPIPLDEASTIAPRRSRQRTNEGSSSGTSSRRT